MLYSTIQIGQFESTIRKENNHVRYSRSSGLVGRASGSLSSLFTTLSFHHRLVLPVDYDHTVLHKKELVGNQVTKFHDFREEYA